VDLVGTHISWVFLTDREAWKVKRPVDLGFLDFSSKEARERACRAEVRINRRLAPDVYRGVVPVRRGPGGATLVGRGPVVDHAVRMRRVPDQRSAAALLDAGSLSHEFLEGLAARLAAFHASCRETPEYGRPEAVARNVRENFAQTAPFVGRFLGPRTFRRVRDRQEAFLARSRGTLLGRVAGRRIREGHGDLRLEHVYFEEGRPGPTVIDAIEFNERFRCGDAASDIAFLAMELEARDRPSLAGRFTGACAEASGDFDLYRVLDFYLSYRAWVRGKVACFVAADPSTPPGKARRKGREARALFALADRFLSPRPRPGPVVAVGGVIGSGKSTVALALARCLGTPVVSSDATRKQLAGIAPTRRGPAAIYAPGFTDRTMAEMLRRAALVADTGRGVVLDATFRSRDLRWRARETARLRGAPFLFVEARCGEAELRRRLRDRSTRASVSDAGEELLPRMLREFEPVTELPAAEHLVLDTSRYGENPAGAVIARLDLPEGRRDAGTPR
jgi:aminoglycoside phosphotransferase family enzyme/predicted kinase